MCAFKNLLVEQDISQTWIAKKLNFSPATINKIVLRGEYPKKNATALKQQIIDLLIAKGLTETVILTAMDAVQLNSDRDQTLEIERTATPPPGGAAHATTQTNIKPRSKKKF